jgi:hypothetical protein
MTVSAEEAPAVDQAELDRLGDRTAKWISAFNLGFLVLLSLYGVYTDFTKPERYQQPTSAQQAALAHAMGVSGTVKALVYIPAHLTFADRLAASTPSLLAAVALAAAAWAMIAWRRAQADGHGLSNMLTTFFTCGAIIVATIIALIIVFAWTASDTSVWYGRSIIYTLIAVLFTAHLVATLRDVQATGRKAQETLDKTLDEVV